MKKTAALILALSMCSGQAFAYENASAGYSVKDRQPFYKAESNKIYAFSDFQAQSTNDLKKLEQSSIHIVNYYTADEMEQILGEKFSTAYFEQQYEKLAVLQNAELSLQTVPLSLLDIKKYAAFEQQNNIILDKQLSKITPTIRIDKFNGQKAITLSYLYKSGKSLINAETTFISANDRLYLLSTATNKKMLDVAEDKTASEKRINDMPSVNNESIGSAGDIDLDDIKTAVQDVMSIEQINRQDMDKALLKKLWKAHTKFVKSFKVFSPAKTERQLCFTDPITKKTVQLPQDWFYGQMYRIEYPSDSNFTIAASLPTMRKIANEMDLEGIFKIFGENDSNNITSNTNSKTVVNDAAKREAMAKQAQAKAEEEARKALASFDAVLIAGSWNIKDKRAHEEFTTMASDRIALNMLLDETLQRLQKHGNDYFALKNYNYSLDFTDEKSTFVLNANTNIMKDFQLSNLLYLGYSNKIGQALLYTHKDNWSNDKINTSIEKWQL